MSESKSKVSHLLIESIMTDQVETFTLATTIGQAIDTLLEKKISGAPVIDQLQRVLTIVTEVDLMRFAALGTLGHKIGDYRNKLVKTEDLVTVKRQDLFPEAFKKFFTRPVRRVLVTDDAGKLQGVVARRDMLRAFLEQKRSS